MTNENEPEPPHDVLPAVPRWAAAYLVCKACGKRGNGPKRLKPKKLAGLVRGAARKDADRARVVMTTCLGLCPKGAIALARAGRGGPRIVPIRSARQVDEAVRLLARIE